LMTSGEIAGWVALAVQILAGVGLFVGRHWIRARIEAGVQHSFDVKLEKLRAEIQATSVRFESELRAKESEIDALRSSVLSGRAGREAMLDKRRFEAVEKVWKGIGEVNKAKIIGQLMAHLNMKAASKAVRDPNFQRFLEAIGTAAPQPKDIVDPARDEEPFVPPLAWAYYSAYRTVLLGMLMQYHILKIGVGDTSDLLATEPIRQMLKEVLPHHAKFIDEHEPNSYVLLLDEIQKSLLTELRKILDGQEADQASTTRAAAIMDAVRQVNNAQTKPGRVGELGA